MPSSQLLSLDAAVDNETGQITIADQNIGWFGLRFTIEHAGKRFFVGAERVWQKGETLFVEDEIAIGIVVTLEI